MAIDTTCTGCNKVLRVADEHAGLSARCPQCGTLYVVPIGSSSSAGQPPSGHSNFAGSSSGLRWLVQTEAGQVYGPVPEGELQHWVSEGRVTATTKLQCEGTTEWTVATVKFPKLKTQFAAPSASSHSSSNPFADQPNDNPYVSPEATSYQAPQSLHARSMGRPHRGGVVLALGIIGICSCVLGSCCFPVSGIFGLPGLVCGILAWVFGAADMKEMQASRMDPSGQSLTQVGMVLGIVTCGLFVLSVVGGIVYFFIALAAEM